MKPSKKKPAKRAVRTGSIEHKLMKLKERISQKQTANLKHIDIKWVEMQLEEIRNGVVIGRGHMLRANEMWSRYA